MRYDVTYHYCERCGLLQTEKPFWLAEAYQAPISALDTDIVARNLAHARKLAACIHFLFPDAGPYLDYAGGYGLLTRMMRDLGFDYYWWDPYCANIFAPGFEVTLDQRFGAVSAFEVLEHVADPIAMFREILDRTHADTVFFSTQLFAGMPPRPTSWDYYALESGQHVSFYKRSTLEAIASAIGMRFLTDGRLHVYTTRNVTGTALKVFAGPLSHLVQLFVRLRRTPFTVADAQSAVRQIHADRHEGTTDSRAQ